MRPPSHLHPKNGLKEQELAKDSHKSVVQGSGAGVGWGGGGGGESKKKKKKKLWDFLRGTADRSPPVNAGDTSSIPSMGIPHATEQQSP